MFLQEAEMRWDSPTTSQWPHVPQQQLPAFTSVHFPNEPREFKRGEWMLSACSHSTFCPVFKEPWCHPCPFGGGGDSVMHISWREDHRPSLYKLLIENLVTSGRKRPRGKSNNPCRPPHTMNGNTPSQKGEACSTSATQEPFLPAEKA